jgi:FkbM family methyltransferase
MLIKFLKFLWHRVLRIIGLRLAIQDYKYKGDLELFFLGSAYGGWSLINDPSLNNGLVVSAGVGEDISFDIEMINKFDTKVILIDPTPRAIAYFNNVGENFGCVRGVPYASCGLQPINSYDLSKSNDQNLKLVPRALWNKTEELKFFEPVDDANVSHSISNFQSQYNFEAKHILVKADTLKNVLFAMSVQENISLLKMDIEGAEHEALESIINDRILPHQILVEYDELRLTSSRGRNRVKKTHKNLLKNGYKLLHCDGSYNFLYLLKNKL